jgi:hypothetical protein
MYLDNVSSSSNYKIATFQLEGYGDGVFFTAAGNSYWNNDTNAITGLQVGVSTGNFTSGTCSLYGMN